MHVRVVRFTDVTPDKVDELVARIEESDGPPPGVPATGLQLLYDADQGTAVVLQHFDTADDMRAAMRPSARWIPRRRPARVPRWI